MATESRAMSTSVVWLAVATLVLGTAAEAVWRAEQFTPAENATVLFLLMWVTASFAVMAFAFASVSVARSWRSTTSRDAVATRVLVLGAILITVALVKWPPLGTGMHAAG